MEGGMLGSTRKELETDRGSTYTILSYTCMELSKVKTNSRIERGVGYPNQEQIDNYYILEKDGSSLSD